MKPTYFLHGLDSSGSGTKGQFFQKNFPTVHCPDFSGHLLERLKQLEKLCGSQTDLQLIGSSYGGLMATSFALKYRQQISGLFLLAPALNYENFTPPKKPSYIPTLLVIGKNDIVTPPDQVIPLAKNTFSNLEVMLEEDDHLLHKSFPTLDWQSFLSK